MVLVPTLSKPYPVPPLCGRYSRKVKSITINTSTTEHITSYKDDHILGRPSEKLGFRNFARLRQLPLSDFSWEILTLVCVIDTRVVRRTPRNFGPSLTCCILLFLGCRKTFLRFYTADHVMDLWSLCDD